MRLVENGAAAPFARDVFERKWTGRGKKDQWLKKVNENAYSFFGKWYQEQFGSFVLLILHFLSRYPSVVLVWSVEIKMQADKAYRLLGQPGRLVLCRFLCFVQEFTRCGHGSQPILSFVTENFHTAVALFCCISCVPFSGIMWWFTSCCAATIFLWFSIIWRWPFTAHERAIIVTCLMVCTPTRQYHGIAKKERPSRAWCTWTTHQKAGRRKVALVAGIMTYGRGKRTSFLR